MRRFVVFGLLFVSLMLGGPVAASPVSVPSPAVETTPTVPSTPIALDPKSGEDERMTRRLRDIFANVPSLAQVQVEVQDGVVTLSGNAPDSAAIDRAAAIASGLSGVVTIENRVQRDVSVDLGEQVGGLQSKFERFVQTLPLLGAAALVAVLVAAFGYLLSSLGSFWHRLAPNSFLADLIVSAIRFSFVVAGIVVALDMLGATALLGAVLGGAGVVGIALGFAMRDTVENYVASLMLSLRQPFRANDHVVIDAHEGRVIRLTSRATVLMTLDGNHLRIPNSSVFKAVILNYTRNPQRRFDFLLGIDADDDPNLGRHTGREVLASLPWVLPDPAPEARIEEVGDSNIVIRFLGWIDQRETDWHKARSRAIAAVKHALEEAGFALPEPIYRLRFDSRTMPLPMQTIAATGTAAPAEKAPLPKSEPQPDAALSEDIAPEKEIERMIDIERSGGGDQDKDLLDPKRPVE